MPKNELVSAQLRKASGARSTTDIASTCLNHGWREIASVLDASQQGYVGIDSSDSNGRHHPNDTQHIFPMTNTSIGTLL